MGIDLGGNCALVGTDRVGIVRGLELSVSPFQQHCGREWILIVEIEMTLTQDFDVRFHR